MLHNSKFNTFLIVLLIIANTFAATYEEQPIYLTISLYALIGIITIRSFFNSTTRQSKYDSIIIAMSIIYFILHQLNTPELKILLIFLTNIIFLIRLKYIPLNATAIGYTILFLFAFIIFTCFNDFLVNLSFTSNDNAFKGIFYNPNTMAGFTTIAISSTFLFVKNKKIILIFIPIFIISLVACKSRNAIVFALSFIAFYYLLKSSLKKATIPIFFGCLIFAIYYLVIIEPQSINSSAVLFGKESGSAGRSAQILLTIKTFPLTLLGIGSNVANDYSTAITGYPIHNMYIHTTYGMGIIYMVIYLYFVIKLYKEVKSNMSKAFFLSSHIYFMFETGSAFSSKMLSFLPIILIIAKINEERQINKQKSYKLL